MSGSARSSLPARVLKVAGVGVVIVLALVVILTALRTELPRSPGVMSDALGPDGGEPVAAYLDRAAASLSVGGDGDGRSAAGNKNDDNNDEDNDTAPAGNDVPRWALVSASEVWTVSDADHISRDLPRVSGLIVQVPVEGVAMPATEVVLAEPVAGEDSRVPVFGRGLERTAAGMAATTVSDGADADNGERSAQAAALTASRIRAGEPAIVGLVVRGTLAQLRDAAARPGVRAVETLPGDAVRGRFAVRPLLPQHAETAAPLPDGGPVPEN